MKLSLAIEDFLIEQQIRGNSEKTVLYYSRTLGFFSAFLGDVNIESITVKDCKNYYLSLKQKQNENQITTTTVQTYIRSVRSFLSWCFLEGFTPVNIPEHFKLPKAQRKVIDVLTYEETQALFKSFDIRTFRGLRNYCICALMLDSGLRLNEVVTLKFGCIRLSDNYIIVNGKGNKQRIVPIGLNTKKHLLRYIARLPVFDDKALFFVKDNFTPIQATTVKQIFRKLKHSTGIERLYPHLLRHTFATRYLENGGDIYSLQQILGHTSLEMVKKYVHSMTRKTVVNFSNFSPLDNLP